MTPFEPTEIDPDPIDANGYCLLCWDYCTNYEECETNRHRNRESPRLCFLPEPHPAHGWQDGWAEFFCRGKTLEDFNPQRLW
jgi:hypothetical protein